MASNFAIRLAPLHLKSTTIAHSFYYYYYHYFASAYLLLFDSISCLLVIIQLTPQINTFKVYIFSISNVIILLRSVRTWDFFKAQIQRISLRQTINYARSTAKQRAAVLSLLQSSTVPKSEWDPCGCAF